MLGKRLLKFSLLTAIAVTILTASAYAANEGAGVVNASSLNLRSEAATSSQVLTTAARGNGVIIRETLDSEWYKVWYRGTEGYMSAEYINFFQTLDGNFGSGKVKGSSVRMRAAADYDSGTLGYYNAGTEMSVTGISGEWYKVSSGGVTGYIHSDYFDMNTSAPAFQTAGAGQTIADAAYKYLDVPYVWAGTSPSGFDCSGFVYYVYKECGYSVNRTAASLYSNGVAVDKASLQVGDIICFTNSSGSNIGHVGIYIGDNQFIHASSGAGYVTITDLESSYYVRTYYGARRIV